MKTFTIQISKTLTMWGLAVNWVILSHSLLCHQRDIWLTDRYTGISMKGLSGQETKFCSTTETFACEEHGREPKCSWWETVENWGLTVSPFHSVREGKGAAGTSPGDVTGLTNEEIRKQFVFLQEILWVNFFNKFRLLHSEKISSVLVIQQQKKKKKCRKDS